MWVIKRLISAAGCCILLKRNCVTCLKSPKSRETPVAPKALDRAVQVAADVFLIRSWMFWEHPSSMAPLAIKSDRVHLASSARSVGTIVVPDQPEADQPEVGAHLSGPFPVIGPIEDGNMGGDGGGCLVVGHYEKIKSSVTGPTTE